MRHFYILIVLFFISCGTKMNLVNKIPLDKTYPELNAITKVEIGISLVTKETGYIYKALQINEDRKVKLGDLTKEIQKGELFLNKYETKKYLLYESQNNNSFGIAISKDGGEQMFFVKTEMGAEIVKLNNPINVTETSTPVKSKEYFRQEFIYNGKVGNGIKFIYREFADDYARPAFTQELQYDLSDSKTVGFRGLRIEVINANNTNIEYKVSNQF
ncbi:hypothetical protein [Flavobacterium pedocola]